MKAAPPWIAPGELMTTPALAARVFALPDGPNGPNA